MRPGKLVGLKRTEYNDLPLVQQSLVAVVESLYFEKFIALVIIVGAIVAGFRQSTEAQVSDSEYRRKLVFIDQVILGIFIGEMLVRMLATFPYIWRYFWLPWNIFDFMIIVTASTEMIWSHYDPEFKDSPAGITFRILRIFRAIRLFRVFRQLQVMVSTLVTTIRSLRWLFLTLAILMYQFALIGVAFFRKNDPFFFESIPHAIVTLFKLITHEGWSQVLYVSQYGCDKMPAYHSQPGHCEPQGFGLWAVLYFVGFKFLMGYVVMNVFIGFILMALLEIAVDVNTHAEIVPDSDEEHDEVTRESLLRQCNLATRSVQQLQKDVGLYYEH